MRRRFKTKIPFENRELLHTWVEVAKTLGTVEGVVYKYRTRYAGFPQLPCTKAGVKAWKRSHIGLQTKQRAERAKVVALRDKGMTFREIARVSGHELKRTYYMWKKGKDEQSTSTKA